MHPKGSVVISFGANKGSAGEGVECFGFFWVPNVFSTYSTSPQCIPQYVPNSISLLSHILWHKFQSCKQIQAAQKGDYNISNFESVQVEIF